MVTFNPKFDQNCAKNPNSDSYYQHDLSLKFCNFAKSGNLKETENYAKFSAGRGIKAVCSLLPPLKIGTTPLHCAAESGQVDAARILIDNGYDVNVAMANLYTPLYLAAQEGKVDMVKFLIQKGAHVNALSAADGMPLHAAAKGCHVEVAKLLIEKGADINVKDKSNYIPLQYAIEKQCKEIEELLIKSADIHWAVKHGYQEVVKSLIEQGVDVNAKDSSGYTPLHWAKDVEMARLLIGKNADINAKDNNGYTMLHWAAKQGYEEIVRLLIKNEADAVRSNDKKLPSELAKDDVIYSILVKYEKSKGIEDQVNKEKEEMKAALEEKLKDIEDEFKKVKDEKAKLLEEISRLRKELEKSDEKISEEDIVKVITGIVSEAKQIFGECYLAKKLDNITSKLQEIENDMPQVAHYSMSQSSQNQTSPLERIMDRLLQDQTLLQADKVRSSVIDVFSDITETLSKCGSAEKIEGIIDKIGYIKDNMPISLDSPAICIDCQIDYL